MLFMVCKTIQLPSVVPTRANQEFNVLHEAIEEESYSVNAGSVTCSVSLTQCVTDLFYL